MKFFSRTLSNAGSSSSSTSSINRGRPSDRASSKCVRKYLWFSDVLCKYFQELQQSNWITTTDNLPPTIIQCLVSHIYQKCCLPEAPFLSLCFWSRICPVPEGQSVVGTWWPWLQWCHFEWIGHRLVDLANSSHQSTKYLLQLTSKFEFACHCDMKWTIHFQMICDSLLLTVALSTSMAVRLRLLVKGMPREVNSDCQLVCSLVRNSWLNGPE